MLEHMWACFFAALPLLLGHAVEKESLHATTKRSHGGRLHGLPMVSPGLKDALEL